MIAKDFIPYDEAVLLKTLGFNEICFVCYVNEDYTGQDDLFFTIEDIELVLIDSDFKRNSDFNESITAPAYQQVFDWFRIEHNLLIMQNFTTDIIFSDDKEYDNKKGGDQNKLTYYFSINKPDGDSFINYGKTDDYKSFDDARLACVKRLINIIK